MRLPPVEEMAERFHDGVRDDTGTIQQRAEETVIATLSEAAQELDDGKT